MSATNPLPSDAQPGRTAMDPASHEQRALSFEHGAQNYNRVRPGYPAPAVTWLTPDDSGPGTRVLDLGAGTGKLTTSLVARGLTVTAVEPSPAMRAELARTVPGADVRDGTAESTGLPDASLDGVVVAQAWHWFDPATAVPELARVLRPGGRLGIVWNLRDTSVGWVDAFTEIIHRGDPLGPPSRTAVLDGTTVPGGPLFGPLERTTFPWSVTMTPAGLRDLAASRSYLLTLDAHARDELLDDVDHLARTHPELRGRSAFELPYVTSCWRAQRLAPGQAPA